MGKLEKTETGYKFTGGFSTKNREQMLEVATLIKDKYRNKGIAYKGDIKEKIDQKEEPKEEIEVKEIPDKSWLNKDIEDWLNTRLEDTNEVVKHGLKKSELLEMVEEI